MVPNNFKGGITILLGSLRLTQPTLINTLDEVLLIYTRKLTIVQQLLAGNPHITHLPTIRRIHQLRHGVHHRHYKTVEEPNLAENFYKKQ